MAMATWRGPPPKLWTSTNGRGVDVVELSELLASTGQNGCQFPQVSGSIRVEPADPLKLRLALDKSHTVVAVYAKGRALPPGMDYMDRFVEKENEDGDLLGGFMSQPKCLVAFGRAVSDGAFAASLHDIAVAPSLQRLGIGRRVVQRILSPLSRRGIGDISVLANAQNRGFFARCGFRPDVLGSTTMLYTRAGSPSTMSKRFGKLELLVPPPYGPPRAVRR